MVLCYTSQHRGSKSLVCNCVYRFYFFSSWWSISWSDQHSSIYWGIESLFRPLQPRVTCNGPCGSVMCGCVRISLVYIPGSRVQGKISANSAESWLQQLPCEFGLRNSWTNHDVLWNVQIHLLCGIDEILFSFSFFDSDFLCWKRISYFCWLTIPFLF